MTITDLCNEVKNWFDVGKRFDNFIIKNETITLDFLSEGQFFRIVGSKFNDGVYMYPCNELKNEEFEGAIWAMAIPPAFLDLLKRINEWEEKNKDVIDSPYQSESWGGYSYTKAGSGSVNYKTAFRSDLNRWRKV